MNRPLPDPGIADARIAVILRRCAEIAENLVLCRDAGFRDEDLLGYREARDSGVAHVAQIIENQDPKEKQ